MNFTILFWLVPLFVVPPLLLGAHYWPQLGRGWRLAWMALVVAIIALFGVRLAQAIATNVNTLPEWDISFFWLNGQIAARGLNFYDPLQYEQLARAALPLPPTQEFQRAVLDVGFWYPPPSMFLFLPLGWFSLRTAAMLWLGFHLLVLIADARLLWRLFLRSLSGQGLLLAFALLLLMFATELNFSYAQTNGLLLLFVLLFWRDRERPRAGVWLALAIVVKPIAAVLGLMLLLHRHWRALLVAAGVLAVLSLAAALAFGPDSFVQFVTAGPTSRQPTWVYSEPVNQSLLATILRTIGMMPVTGSPVMQPLFLALAVAMTLVSAWLIWRLPRAQGGWAIAIAVSLGLLIYPATLNHYSMLLVPVLLLAWQYRQFFVADDRRRLLALIAFISLAYFFVAYRYGNMAFVANVWVWLGVCALAWVRVKAQHVPLTSQVGP